MYLFDCHMWACCGPGQLPHMGQFCACSLPCMCVLIAISVPVDCHTGASCLPHRCLVSATCGPHVGQTTATCGPHVGQRCKTRVAHLCALGGSNFNCHMWALYGPLVECLLGIRCKFCYTEITLLYWDISLPESVFASQC